MKLAQLNALIAISRVRSINEAARAIGLSQPALSKTIRTLENELGAPLLHRRADGVSLTTYGYMVIKRAKGVHKEIDRLWDEISTLRHQMGGRLSIGLTSLAAAVGVAAAASAIRKRLPAIELEFIDMRPRQIIDGLREGTLDLGLLTLYNETMVPGLECHLVDSFPSMLLTGGGRHQGLTPIKDLLAQEWIDCELTGGTTSYIETLAAHARLPMPTTIHRSTSLHLGMELAAELGAICHAAEISMPFLEQVAISGRLTRLATNVALPSMNIVLAYPRQELLTPAAQEAARVLLARRQAGRNHLNQPAPSS